MMRKFLFVAAIALLGTVGLSACQKGEQGTAPTEAKATRPSASAVDDALKACQAKHPQQTAPASEGTSAADSGDTSDDSCVRATIAATTWQAYLQEVVTANMGDVTSNPYMYFVPSSKYPENEGAISRTQDQVDATVVGTILPGYMVAAAGPDSATTAQVLENAFKQASPGSFKGVVVLFIGDKADEAAVKAAVDPSGATFKFAQM